MKGSPNRGDTEYFSLENHYFFFLFQIQNPREKGSAEESGTTHRCTSWMGAVAGPAKIKYETRK